MAKDDLLKQVEDLTRTDLDRTVAAAADPRQEVSRVADRATKLMEQLNLLPSVTIAPPKSDVASLSR
jgi:hypothetical protein